MVISVGSIPWYLDGAIRALFSRWIITFPVQRDLVSIWLVLYNTFLQHDAGWKVGENDKDTCAKKFWHKDTCMKKFSTVHGF